MPSKNRHGAAACCALLLAALPGALPGAAPAMGICDRSPLAQALILKALRDSGNPRTCGRVSPQDLAGIRELDSSHYASPAMSVASPILKNPPPLREGDLEGLSNLERLDLAHTWRRRSTRLGRAPTTNLSNGLFEKLTKLRVVHLHGNGFTRVPGSLWTLPELQVLNLSNNNIRDVPPEVEKAAGTLRALYLSHNNLGEFTPEFWNLIELEELHLAGNHWLTDIPSEIERLAKLKKLVIDKSLDPRPRPRPRRNPQGFPRRRAQVLEGDELGDFLRAVSSTCFAKPLPIRGG